MNTVTKAALTGAATTASVIGSANLAASPAISTLLWALAVVAPWTPPVIGIGAPVAGAAGLAALIAFIWRR